MYQMSANITFPPGISSTQEWLLCLNVDAKVFTTYFNTARNWPSTAAKRQKLTIVYAYMAKSKFNIQTK